MSRPLAIAAALVLLAGTLSASAQPAGNVPRIGVLAGGIPESPTWSAFREALRALGHVEGQNVVIEWRSSQGAERFPDLAAELVRLKVDVIVAGDNPAIAAAQAATRTIPIVMLVPTDPVGTGVRCQPRAAGRQYHRADAAGQGVTRRASGN